MFKKLFLVLFLLAPAQNVLAVGPSLDELEAEFHGSLLTILEAVSQPDQSEARTAATRRLETLLGHLARVAVTPATQDQFNELITAITCELFDAMNREGDANEYIRFIALREVHRLAIVDGPLGGQIRTMIVAVEAHRRSLRNLLRREQTADVLRFVAQILHGVCGHDLIAFDALHMAHRGTLAQMSDLLPQVARALENGTSAVRTEMLQVLHALIEGPDCESSRRNIALVLRTEGLLQRVMHVVLHDTERNNRSVALLLIRRLVQPENEANRDYFAGLGFLPEIARLAHTEGVDAVIQSNARRVLNHLGNRGVVEMYEANQANPTPFSHAWLTRRAGHLNPLLDARNTFWTFRDERDATLPGRMGVIELPILGWERLMAFLGSIRMVNRNQLPVPQTPEQAQQFAQFAQLPNIPDEIILMILGFLSRAHLYGLNGAPPKPPNP